MATRIFVTGATGFVGSAVVDELLEAGYQVMGLVRSPDRVSELVAKGVQPIRGDLSQPESLRAGAEAADGIIHTGFVHDFSRYAQCCEIDRRAIETMGGMLRGSTRPLIVTSGVPIQAPGRKTVETDPAPSPASGYPRKSEAAIDALAQDGVKVAAVRLPPSVHGAGDHGFVPTLIDIARERGFSAYFSNRENHWPAVHRIDAARLFRRVLAHDPAEGPFHAVAEEAIPFRKIAEAIATLLAIPAIALNDEEAKEHFSWFHMFASMDCAASSEHTRSLLGWHPTQPDLLSDIANAGYAHGPRGLM